jgi:hypothetical protein
MSELGTKFTHDDYSDLIRVAIKQHPSSSSKVAETIRRAETRSTALTTTGGPRTTAKDLQNLSQIDFLELIAEIVVLHPQFIVRVREACQRVAGRCPQPVDYQKIQTEFDQIIMYRGDHDPDVHGPLSDCLEPLVEKVVESVNFNSSRAVLDDAFQCLYAMEIILLDEDAQFELDEECIVDAMVKVGAIWKAKGGPTGPNGVGIKKMMVKLVKNNSNLRDYEDVLEQVWGCTEAEICDANPRKRGRVH